MAFDKSERLKESAKALHTRLKSKPWLTAVAVGREHDQNCFVVYVTSRSRQVVKEIPTKWKGFPVVVRKMGFPRPLQGACII